MHSVYEVTAVYNVNKDWNKALIVEMSLQL